jgi:hypothetical protein
VDETSTPDTLTRAKMPNAARTSPRKKFENPHSTIPAPTHSTPAPRTNFAKRDHRGGGTYTGLAAARARARLRISRCAANAPKAQSPMINPAQEAAEPGNRAANAPDAAAKPKNTIPRNPAVRRSASANGRPRANATASAPHSPRKNRISGNPRVVATPAMHTR